MKNSDQRNMFMMNAESVLDRYAPFIEGDPRQTMAAVSSRPLSDKARSALANSAAALGFGADSLTYICTAGIAGARSEEVQPADLLTMLEGMDPISFVVADSQAAEATGKAYRCAVETDAFQRIRGRDVVAFEDIESMLGDDGSKQKMWALLKNLRLT